MKLYRHYKNKFYGYIGVARHSETGEELALYETRYESPGGKTWVRPLKMFHEDFEPGRPRFAPVEVDYREFTAVGDAELRDIASLMKTVFGEWDPKWFHGTFDNHRRFHLLVARIDGTPVAFKLGYEMNPREFYSWLGGVVPEFRGVGLAGELMRRQHEWARAQGYARVQTKTRNRFADMLMLNLRHGFEIIGTYDSDTGLKIVMEKKLITQ